MSFKKRIIAKLWSFLPIDIVAKRESKRDKKDQKLTFSDEKHLLETAKWLCRAQNNTPDGGVSRAFKSTKHKAYGPYGWQPSYPETTGYIIPTMIVLSEFFSDPSFSERAIRMADWEIDIQLSSGAVMGSVVSAPPSPAVFNTGQVIFGWLAAFKKTGDDKYLKAALNAGDYLFSTQDSNGSWQKGDSRFALKGATTYNTRVAWSLIELGIESCQDKYIDAGKKNIELALVKQNDNGWFADNCLNDPEKPLLHTIVYATRGILESGISLDNSRYINAGLKALNALTSCQRPDGGLPGRLSSDWTLGAEWDCVTGDAQVAIAWQRAHSITGENKYKASARSVIDFIKRTQNLKHPNPGIRGGVKGSFPFNGSYGKYEMLNWAAKFFCDSLLMANNEKLAKKGIKG